MSRWLWVAIGALPVLLWAFLALFPVSVDAAAPACNQQCVVQAVTNAIGKSPGAGTGVSALGWWDPSSQIANIAAGWLPKAQSMAQNLYLSLFVIELFMLGLQTILFRDNLGEFFAGLAFKAFVAGFFIWLITDASQIFTSIIGSFNQAGQTLTGASTSSLSKLYGEEVGAVMLFIFSMLAALLGSSAAENLCDVSAGCVSAISTLAQPLALICGAMAILVFASLLVLSLTYIMITIETFIVMCGGVFFLGFAGTRFTMPFSQGYLRYAINVGIKLFAFWLVIAIEGQLIPGVLGNAGLVAGTAALGGGITAAIAATGSSSVAAQISEDVAKKAAVNTAIEASLAAAIAGQNTLGLAAGAATTLALGNGVPGANSGFLASAPETNQLAIMAGETLGEGPADGAKAAAGAASVASSAPIVAAAATTAFLGVMFAAFGALQVIVLNALASAVPTLASSLISGSSLLSAQETLKGVGSTFAEASVTVSTIASKMNSVFLAKMDSTAKILDRERRRNEEATVNDPKADPAERKHAMDMITERAEVAPQVKKDREIVARQARQLHSQVLPQIRQGVQLRPVLPVAGPLSETRQSQPQQAPPVATPQSGNGSEEAPSLGASGIESQQPRPSSPPRAPVLPTVSAASASPASSTAGGQPIAPQGSATPRTFMEKAMQEQLDNARADRAEEAEKRNIERDGLAGLTNAQRDALSHVKREKLIAGIVNGDYAMTDELRAWISSNPYLKALWNRRSLEKRNREQKAGVNSGLLKVGIIEGALLAGNTHSGKDGGLPGFGDPGIKS